MITTLMTARELADFLKIHRESVYYLIRTGDIRGMKVGGKWLFDPDEVLASLQVQAGVGGLEGDFDECGYDDSEAGEAAAGNGDGVAIAVNGTGGARCRHCGHISATMGKPV